ncbi:MAG: hypothetical protein F6K55_15250 [Moorea sp. SIO4A3]|nr:hypothetical protein [Moorena sp. SIO4A3]
MVSALGGTMLVTVAGAIGLSVANKEVPDILVGIGTGSLGSLAGLLAPAPSRD